MFCGTSDMFTGLRLKKHWQHTRGGNGWGFAPPFRYHGIPIMLTTGPTLLGVLNLKCVVLKTLSRRFHCTSQTYKSSCQTEFFKLYFLPFFSGKRHRVKNKQIIETPPIGARGFSREDDGSEVPVGGRDATFNIVVVVVVRGHGGPQPPRPVVVVVPGRHGQNLRQDRRDGSATVGSTPSGDRERFAVVVLSWSREQTDQCSGRRRGRSPVQWQQHRFDGRDVARGGKGSPAAGAGTRPRPHHGRRQDFRCPEEETGDPRGLLRGHREG